LGCLPPVVRQRPPEGLFVFLQTGMIKRWPPRFQHRHIQDHDLRLEY
jgi:hypothetical protein